MKTTRHVSVDFEKAFTDFIDTREYDKAENVPLAMIRMAFNAGWSAAGGGLSNTQKVIEMSITPDGEKRTYMPITEALALNDAKKAYVPKAETVTLHGSKKAYWPKTVTMTLNEAKEAYLPMTESMYYILLSLTEPRHGYGIMQHVEEITGERIRLGAGTIYNSLAKLERDSLIVLITETERRKTYLITDVGQALLKAEINRLEELSENGELCNIR